jgi:hypothetical protein
MCCGRKHPAKHAFAHRRSFGRKQFTMTAKNDRRRFLNEMRRSANPIRACQVIHIRWSTFVEWQQSGFITQAMLDEATAVFKLKHPTVDMLAAHTPDEQGIAGLPVEAVDDIDVAPVANSTQPPPIPAIVMGDGAKAILALHGYTVDDVLADPTGWSDDGDYEIE